MSNLVRVGMAEIDIAQAPDKIRTTGLGSCVGVVLFDRKAKVAGMAHVMLPSSQITKENLSPGKYADSAIPLLIKKMESAGAAKRRMVAKLAGGAQMFSFSSGGDAMRIGPRNVEACKLALKAENIPVVAEETGGSFGRTIEIDSATGMLLIKTVNQGVKEV